MPDIKPPNKAPVPTCSPTPSLNVRVESAFRAIESLPAIWATPPWPASSSTCVPMLPNDAFSDAVDIGAASNLATNLPMAIAAGATLAAVSKPTLLASTSRASTIDIPESTSLLNSVELAASLSKGMANTSLTDCWNAPPASMPPMRAAVPPCSPSFASSCAFSLVSTPEVTPLSKSLRPTAPPIRVSGPTPIREPTA